MYDFIWNIFYFSVVIEEFKRIIHMIVEKHDDDKRQWLVERSNIKQDLDEKKLHLINILLSLDDVNSWVVFLSKNNENTKFIIGWFNRKYERCKNLINVCKANEEFLKQMIGRYEEIMKKKVERYEQLKQHAMSQLDKWVSL